MKSTTKLIIIALLSFMVAMPVLGAFAGWGIGTERNANVMNGASAYCPPTMTRPDGTCQRTVRSYYFGRSAMGGGPNYGK